MRTIAIPQLYCGASGKKGAYNRQEVGLARAFAALGCRAVVLYPDPDAAPEAVTSEDLEPNVRIYYVPARKAGVSAFYRTWQPLLNEHVDAVQFVLKTEDIHKPETPVPAEEETPHLSFWQKLSNLF